MTIYNEKTLSVPVPLKWRWTICSTDFFVQSILADRQIHRRVGVYRVGVVSLESPSSVEYQFRKNSFNFAFSEELWRFKFRWTFAWFPLFTFSFIFAEILINFDKKYVKIFKTRVNDLTFKEILKCLIEFLSQKSYIELCKISIITKKHHQICFFSPLWSNLQQVQTKNCSKNLRLICKIMSTFKSKYSLCTEVCYNQ